MSPCSAAAAWPSPCSLIGKRLGVALGGHEHDALPHVDVGQQMVEHPVLVRAVVGEVHALLDRQRRGLRCALRRRAPDRASGWLARRPIAPSNVAENSTVCRVAGVSAQMRSTSSTKPMSSMRSASSSTSTSRRERSTRPRSMWSMQPAGRRDEQVGAALQLAVLHRIGRAAVQAYRGARAAAGRSGSPARRPAARVRASARAPARAARWPSGAAATADCVCRDRRCSAGSTNAAVLPVPVCAEPMTSRPASSAGMVCAWIGVGSS